MIVDGKLSGCGSEGELSAVIAAHVRNKHPDRRLANMVVSNDVDEHAGREPGFMVCRAEVLVRHSCICG